MKMTEIKKICEAYRIGYEKGKNDEIDKLHRTEKADISTLREKPITVSSEESRSVFGLTANWRPAHYITNKFQNNGDGTILDSTTGLMWEQSGSEKGLCLKDVPAYVKEMNIKKLGGFKDWRLPTMEELLSLMEIGANKWGLHINLIFDEEQWWIWSSDLRSGGGAWYVYFDLGRVGWGEGNGRCVRLVRRGQ